jgi:hypothetical protein
VFMKLGEEFAISKQGFCARIYNRRDVQRSVQVVRDMIRTITIQEIGSICTAT